MLGESGIGAGFQPNKSWTGSGVTGQETGQPTCQATPRSRSLNPSFAFPSVTSAVSPSLILCSCRQCRNRTRPRVHLAAPKAKRVAKGRPKCGNLLRHVTARTRSPDLMDKASYGRGQSQRFNFGNTSAKPATSNVAVSTLLPRRGEYRIRTCLDCSIDLKNPPEK